jgi:LmbE family N-acetylglucosaminyl deacetylase
MKNGLTELGGRLQCRRNGEGGDLLNILIISPHMDDEVLGCAGMMAAYPNNHYHVIYMTKSPPPRDDEAAAAADYLGFSYTALNHPDGRLYQEDVPTICEKIQGFIKKLDPESIFIPFQSIHQDHQSTYNIGRIACRNFVGRLYLYEYPESTGYFSDFQATEYLDMSEATLTKKIRSMECYKSQLATGRDSDSIRHLAITRGYEAHCRYAEAYTLVKGRFNLNALGSRRQSTRTD